MSGEVPDGWKTTTLAAACDFFTDGDWVESKDQNPDGEVRLIQLADIGDGLFQDKSSRFLTAEKARELRCSMLETNDLLIARMADPIARCCLFPGLDQPAATVVDVAIARAREGVDQRFLSYAVSTRPFRELALGAASGTTRSRISRSNLGALPILLPPLDEQRRIAEVLRSADDAEATLEASLKSALLVRQTTLDEVMQSEASSADHQPLESVAEVRTGLAKNAGRAGTKVSLPYLRVANVQDGWIDLTEVKAVEVDPSAISKYRLQEGDVLLTEGGDYDKLGRGGVWGGEIDPCLHQNHVFAVRPDRTKVSSAFLALLTQSYLGRAYFLSCAKRTTNLASINSSQLKKLPVPVLSLSRQHEIVSEIGSLDRFIAIEKERRVALRRLQNALSHDLLSGRVRVPALAQAVSTGRAVQPAFKRAVFAAEVVHQLHNDDRFGSVKHEKIVHLCELHLRLQDDLDRHAYKEAAGPYDPSARRSVERIFRQQKWFNPTKQDKRIVYQPLDASGGHARYFDRYFGDRKAEVQNIIDLLRPLTTQQCEIIATLYAVWNDFLIDGRQPDDDEIVDGVLNNWTESKRQIPEDKWRSALPWMRQRGLIPAGHGEKTRVAST